MSRQPITTSVSDVATVGVDLEAGDNNDLHSRIKRLTEEMKDKREKAEECMEKLNDFYFEGRPPVHKMMHKGTYSMWLSDQDTPVYKQAKEELVKKWHNAKAEVDKLKDEIASLESELQGQPPRP